MPRTGPRHFSFNSPFGACQACGGLGTRREVNADLILGDPGISLLEGVILPWGEPDGYLRRVILPGLAKQLGFDLNTPWGKLTKKVREVLLFGAAPGQRSELRGQRSEVRGQRGRGAVRPSRAKGAEGFAWQGILISIQRRFSESESDQVRAGLLEYMVVRPCQGCGGRRLKPESLAVTVHGRNLGEVAELSIVDAQAFFEGIPLRRDGDPGLDPDIGGPILKEVRERLRFLVDVGLDYLTLAGRPNRCPGARRSASGWPRKSARAWWGCCTSWTSRPSGCTSAITRGSCARWSGCATWGTR